MFVQGSSVPGFSMAGVGLESLVDSFRFLRVLLFRLEFGDLVVLCRRSGFLGFRASDAGFDGWMSASRMCPLF